MKKLVLFFVAALAISFASCCGNKSAQPEVAPEVDEVVVVDEAAPADEEVVAEGDVAAVEVVEAE